MSTRLTPTRVLAALAALFVSMAAWAAPGTPATTEKPSADEATEPESPPPDPASSMGPPDPFNRGTPMGAMYGYLAAAGENDLERAAEYLDLRKLGRGTTLDGPELARQLKVVLDHGLWVEIEYLSADSEGFEEDGLSAWQERIGDIETEDGPVPMLLQRVPRAEDGVLVWKVSADTVGQVPELYAQFEPVWLETMLPAVFFDVSLLHVALWKWLALIGLLVGSIVLAMATSGIVTKVVGRLALARPGTFDERVVLLVQGPVRLAFTVLLFGLGHRTLGLAIAVASPLAYLERTLLVLAGAWLSFRMIDFSVLVIRERAEARELDGVVPVLMPGARFAKAVIILFATLGALGALGVNVTAVVAGLGVGGIAVALAAQKSLEHLFGGVSLVIDQPVRVGDFFSWGEGVGIVEEIGLRSTRIRTLDRTIVTIPNAEFSNLRLENFAKRDALLLRTTLHVRLDTTPDQLRDLLASMRGILVGHPRVTEDPARVRFVGFGESSIDLEVFAYVDTDDWNEFLGIREDLLLRFMDAISEAGTRIAFPTSTTYVAPDAGLDAALVRDAESRIAALRSRGALPFPEMPEGERDALFNRLDWPPEGAPRTKDGD